MSADTPSEVTATESVVARLVEKQRIASNAALMEQGACFAPGTWREWARVAGEAATLIRAQAAEIAELRRAQAQPIPSWVNPA